MKLESAVAYVVKMLTWYIGELPDDMADTSSLWLTGLHWMTWRWLVC
jgi:hypothetical protein